MKEFLSACIKKTNTKYFTYFRFLLIGIIAIPILFIFFKAIPLAEAAGGLIDGSVNPVHATTTITLSGDVTGTYTRGVRCPDLESCTLWQDSVQRVTAMVYSIDDAASVSMVFGTDWQQTTGGEPTDCGSCTNYQPYEYSFNKAINISALPPGIHTIVVRATTQGGVPLYLRDTYTFDNIPFIFNIAPEINFGSTYQGGSTSAGVRISRIQGPAELVTAAITENAPPNSTITFSPASSCTPNDECVITMNVQTQPSTPTGTYHMRITGTSPSASGYAYYDLTVTPLPPLVVTVTAEPHIGLAPLTGVEIIVDVGGSATGPINIQGNCGNNTLYGPLQTFSVSGTSSTSYHFVAACNYTPVEETSYMVTATVTRGGYTESNTAMVSTTLAQLEPCAESATGPGGLLDAKINEFWPETTLEVREARNYSFGESSLRGGFYAIRFQCTNCLAESGTTYVSGDITNFQYRFDNLGVWTPLTYYVDWGPGSVIPMTPICISCTSCYFSHEQMYYMYRFNFNRNISALSVGSHTLNLRAREEWSYAGGIDPSGYTYVNWMYQNIDFARNGWPGVELLGPVNGSYLNIANPNPNFQARITDPNINQPLRAHFQVNGFGEYDGTATTTPGTSEWNPTLLVDGTYTWQAYASDSAEARSSWSPTWSFTRDTMLPYASISYPLGSYDNTVFRVYLIELDERTSVVRGDVQMRSRLINGTWSVWGTTGLPNNGTTMVDFDFTGTRGYEYEFQYRATDGAGNVSDWVSPGTVTIASNVSPTATGLSFSTTVDICGASSGYFFSWTYSDGDGDPESRYEFEIDDNSDYSSPVVSTFNDNPQSVDNGVAVPIRPTIQPGNLTYNNTRYYWHVRVYDNRVPPNNSGWVSGAALTTPSHHLPDCIFTWSPINPNPGQSTIFTDASTCYDTSGNTTSCTDWSWTFTGGNPATSTLRNPTTVFTTSGTKDVTLRVTDSLGTQCSLTRQVTVSLPLPKWREIRPW